MKKQTVFRLCIQIMLGVVVLLSASILLAAPASQPVNPEDLPSLWQQMLTHFSSTHYREGVATLITLLMALWRKSSKLFIDRIPHKYLPWIVAAASLLTYIPVQLLSGNFNWFTFVYNTFLASAEAMALWTLVLKYPLGKKEETPAQPPG